MGMVTVLVSCSMRLSYLQEDVYNIQCNNARLVIGHELSVDNLWGLCE